MPTSKERRHSPRGISSIPLEIYDPKGKMIVGEGHFINFSMSGGRMESPNSFKAKSAIRLHMVPSGKSALEIIGRVVWTQKHDAGFTYGIRFSSRDPAPPR